MCSFRLKILKVLLLFLISGSVWSGNIEETPHEIPDSIQTMLENDEPGIQINAYLLLSDMFYYDDPDASLKYITRASEIAEENNMQKKRIQVYLHIGVFFIDKSNFPKAEQYYQKALDLALEINDTTLLPSIYGNFGNINMYKGNYEKAISLFIEAYKLFERANNELGMLKALGALGNLNLHLPDYNQAIIYYERAYERFRKLGDIEGAATTLMNLGICYKNLKQYDKADENYRIAYDEFKQAGFQKLAAQCLANRATVLQNTGNFAKALQFSGEAYEVFMSFGDSVEAAACLKDIGITFFNQGQFDKALVNFNEAYRIINRSSQIQSEISLLHEMIITYDSLQDFKNAYNYFILLQNLKDSLYNAETHEQIIELRNKFELEQKEKEIEIQDLLIEKQKTDVDRYQRERWFFIILLVLFGFTAWSVFNRFKLKQKHKEENLMRKNIEIEQHLLRSQMNPHFIFNSLNSIQGLISGDDAYLAEIYLSKFAQLVRSILENSKKATVSLSEDISNLKLYLDLESMRFADSFEYKLIVDPIINTEEVFVPPLLVQPFVENSIKHGLVKLTDRNGLIKIDYYKQGEYLFCVVEDNGIGRKASIKLKKRNSNHKSLGMKVTQERLDSLNKQFKTQASAEIIDLEDENGNALGTKVMMKIAFQNL